MVRNTPKHLLTITGIVLLLSVFCSHVLAKSNQKSENKVLIFGETLSKSRAFQKEIENKGFSVSKIQSNQIELINTGNAKNT